MALPILHDLVKLRRHRQAPNNDLPFGQGVAPENPFRGWPGRCGRRYMHLERRKACKHRGQRPPGVITGELETHFVKTLLGEIGLRLRPGAGDNVEGIAGESWPNLGNKPAFGQPDGDLGEQLRHRPGIREPAIRPARHTDNLILLELIPFRLDYQCRYRLVGPGCG